MIALLPAPAAWAATKPEAAVQTYFEMLRGSGGFVSTVALLHPDGIEHLRQIMMPVFEADERSRDGSMRKAALGAESTLEDVRSASPADYARLFYALFGGRAGNASPAMDFDVVGKVREGKDVHVVVRVAHVEADSPASRALRVVSLRRDGKRWRLLMTPELEAFARGLRASLGQAQGRLPARHARPSPGSTRGSPGPG